MKYFLSVTLLALLFHAYFALPIQEVKEDKIDPEEIEGFFDGDMILTAEQVAAINQSNTIRGENFRWPNNIVYYEFIHKFDEEQKQAIENALNDIEKNTCIKFKYRTATAEDYIQITGYKIGHCTSLVGRLGGRQVINLHVNKPGSGCFKHGAILHEFLHALGFYHQHMASNRDEYITIVWENVEKQSKRKFIKFSDKRVINLGVPYDYDSIMHYGPKEFSKNGSATIVPHDKNAVIGQRERLSEGDIKKLNIMYKCPGY